MRLVVMMTAAGAWCRNLALPLAVAASGLVLFAAATLVDLERAWPISVSGAITAGVAVAWTGRRLTDRARREDSDVADGESEPF